MIPHDASHEIGDAVPEVVVFEAAELQAVSAAVDAVAFAVQVAFAEVARVAFALASVYFAAPASVVLVFAADVAGPRASVDTAAASDFLILFFDLPDVVDNHGRPRFVAFPNVGYYSTPSSSVSVVGWESVYSPTGGRTSFGPDSNFSNRGLHQNKNLACCHNMSSPG